MLVLLGGLVRERLVEIVSPSCRSTIFSVDCVRSFKFSFSNAAISETFFLTSYGALISDFLKVTHTSARFVVVLRLPMYLSPVSLNKLT